MAGHDRPESLVTMGRNTQQIFPTFEPSAPEATGTYGFLLQHFKNLSISIDELSTVTGENAQTIRNAISQGRYLRTLLIHGARSVLTSLKEPSVWVEQIRKRRPDNVVTVALANKMARTIWALLAHDRLYESAHVSIRPT